MLTMHLPYLCQTFVLQLERPEWLELGAELLKQFHPFQPFPAAMSFGRIFACFTASKESCGRACNIVQARHHDAVKDNADHKG